MAKRQKSKKKMNSPFKGFIICGICAIIILSFVNYFNIGKGSTYKAFQATSAQNLNTEASSSANNNPSSTPQKNDFQDQPPQGKNLNVPILTYHYISTADPKDKARQNLSVPAEVFDAQMKHLVENGYQTITLDDLRAVFFLGHQLPQKPVIITLDDGYSDAYINAFQILKKYNLKATAFVLTDLVDSSPYLNWDQIKEMQNSGLITIASHGKSHIWLPGFDQKTIEDQVIGSKTNLESHLGTPVNWYCYPYGAFDNQTITAVKKAGYIGAVSTLPGPINYQSEIYTLRRVRAGNFNTLFGVSK